jgi:hypothetical protein
MSSRPHVVMHMNDDQLRHYIVQLEKRLEYMSETMTRLQNDSIARDRSVTHYHQRVGEMNDTLRRNVEVLIGAMTGNAQYERYDRKGEPPTPPPDLVDAVREMTKHVIRSRIKNTGGALTSEESIAHLVHRSIDSVVRATVDAEMGIDSRGDIDLKKSKVAPRIKGLLEGRVEALFADDGHVQKTISDAINKAVKRFQREGGRAVFDYALDHLRNRFHDLLTHRIQDAADRLARELIQDVFEKAVVEEMPFIEPYVALLRLGQKVEMPDDF